MHTRILISTGGSDRGEVAAPRAPHGFGAQQNFAFFCPPAPERIRISGLAPGSFTET